MMVDGLRRIEIGNSPPSGGLASTTRLFKRVHEVLHPLELDDVVARGRLLRLAGTGSGTGSTSLTRKRQRFKINIMLADSY
jgi:hypothetical protein